ncbi:hypothetical protein, partial [Marinobacter sp.]|uniref:hypothetical protein n=1 Tax=Marinobacter sp. TaxID=50741 RepID=UPI003567090F
AQDKTQFSTSHCPDISYLKYLGQRPHELLGQLFKERLSVSLLNQGGVFYTEQPSCQPLSKETLKDFLQILQAVIASIPTDLSGQPLKRDAHSTDLSQGVNGRP